MSYTDLTIEERCCLREYYLKGYSYRKIAELIGRNVSTVSRELKRNRTHMYDIPTYYPYTAQKKYLLRRSYCHRGMFQDFEKLEYIKEKLNCNVYFADPYCAWQKGTNENLNGLLREFYPKGRNLSRVSPATLKKNLELINSRPKKVLYYKKPIDLFNDCLEKCCT